MKNKLLLMSIAILIVFISFIFIVILANNHNNDNNENISYVSEVDEFADQVSDKILICDGWVGADKIDVRKEPSETGEIVGHINFNEKVTYKIYDNKWFIIQYNDSDAYIPSKYILDKKADYDSYNEYYLDNIVGYKTYSITNNTGFKSYMDYRAITSKNSNQYKLQHSYAETGNYGIRMIDGRYCVAIGSHFTRDIGQYFDLILENGTVIPCILADQKSDKDTDWNNISTMHNGCVSEFVVDNKSLNEDAKHYGDMSFCTNEWNSRVLEVKVYNKNIFDE